MSKVKRENRALSSKEILLLQACRDEAGNIIGGCSKSDYLALSDHEQAYLLEQAETIAGLYQEKCNWPLSYHVEIMRGDTSWRYNPASTGSTLRLLLIRESISEDAFVQLSARNQVWLARYSTSLLRLYDRGCQDSLESLLSLGDGLRDQLFTISDAEWSLMLVSGTSLSEYVTIKRDGVKNKFAHLGKRKEKNKKSGRDIKSEDKKRERANSRFFNPNKKSYLSVKELYEEGFSYPLRDFMCLNLRQRAWLMSHYKSVKEVLQYTSDLPEGYLSVLESENNYSWLLAHKRELTHFLEQLSKYDSSLPLVTFFSLTKSKRLDVLNLERKMLHNVCCFLKVVGYSFDDFLSLNEGDRDWVICRSVSLESLFVQDQDEGRRFSGLGLEKLISFLKGRGCQGLLHRVADIVAFFDADGRDHTQEELLDFLSLKEDVRTFLLDNYSHYFPLHATELMAFFKEQEDAISFNEKNGITDFFKRDGKRHTQEEWLGFLSDPGVFKEAIIANGFSYSDWIDFKENKHALVEEIYRDVSMHCPIDVSLHAKKESLTFFLDHKEVLEQWFPGENLEGFLSLSSDDQQWLCDHYRAVQLLAKNKAECQDILLLDRDLANVFCQQSFPIREYQKHKVWIDGNKAALLALYGECGCKASLGKDILTLAEENRAWIFDLHPKTWLLLEAWQCSLSDYQDISGKAKAYFDTNNEAAIVLGKDRAPEGATLKTYANIVDENLSIKEKAAQAAVARAAARTARENKLRDLEPLNQPTNADVAITLYLLERFLKKLPTYLGDQTVRKNQTATFFEKKEKLLVGGSIASAVVGVGAGAFFTWAFPTLMQGAGFSVVPAIYISLAVVSLMAGLFAAVVLGVKAGSTRKKRISFSDGNSQTLGLGKALSPSGS